MQQKRYIVCLFIKNNELLKKGHLTKKFVGYADNKHQAISKWALTYGIWNSKLDPSLETYDGHQIKIEELTDKARREHGEVSQEK